MSNKTYMVEYVTWNEKEGDWEDEEQCWDITGIEAINKIAEFLRKYPEAHEANVETDPEDGMFISLAYMNEEAGKEYWIDAYCRDKE